MRAVFPTVEGHEKVVHKVLIFTLMIYIGSDKVVSLHFACFFSTF